MHRLVLPLILIFLSGQALCNSLNCPDGSAVDGQKRAETLPIAS